MNAVEHRHNKCPLPVRSFAMGSHVLACSDFRDAFDAGLIAFCDYPVLLLFENVLTIVPDSTVSVTVLIGFCDYVFGPCPMVDGSHKIR